MEKHSLEEGILQSEGLYARGMRNGRWRLFSNGGLQNRVVPITMTKRTEGLTLHLPSGETWISSTFQEGQTSPKLPPKCRENGGVWSADFPTLSSGCQNLDGARIGIWETAHYEGGIRYRSRYVDGLQQGLHEGFHINGRRSWVGFYEDDRPIGSHFFFDQQGRQIDLSFIDQSGTGEWRRWSHLGKTAASGRFRVGFQNRSLARISPKWCPCRKKQSSF